MLNGERRRGQITAGHKLSSEAAYKTENPDELLLKSSVRLRVKNVQCRATRTEREV